MGAVVRHMLAEGIRFAAALTVLGGAIVLHAGAGPPFRGALVAWCCSAVALGGILRHWWALGLAAVPWPVGLGIGLLSGRYAFLGENWQLSAAISALVGAGGIALGVILGRYGRHRLR